jgi:hypothetical protein
MEFGHLKLRRCRHGWMLFHGPYIGRCLELYGEYSEGEVETMRTYVGRGDTVIDVGANIGALTLPLAHMVGEGGRVYAIESHPDNFNVLCANLAMNALAQVKPINKFVRVDPASGTGNDTGESFVGERWPPSFLALDELGLDSCALIKIDVDGRELEALKSAAHLVDRTRPVLYFENDQQAASEALLRYVMDLDYELYWHVVPLFRPDNYLGNPENAWAPNRMISAMVLALPAERSFAIPDLDVIEQPGDWFR